MSAVLGAISETLITVPGLVLCIACVWNLPTSSHRGLLLSFAGAIVVLCITGWASAALAVPTSTLFVPAMLAMGVLFWRPSSLAWGPFFYVAASGATLSSCIENLSIVAEIIAGGTLAADLYRSPSGIITQWVLCLLCVAILWYPVYRHGPELLRNPVATAWFWKVAWAVPVAVFAALVFAVPQNAQSMADPGVLAFFTIQTCVLTALFMLVQVLFWLLARQARTNEMAQERSRRLEMLALQADHFDRTVQEAREARHDLRQHARVLGALASAGDLDRVRDYVRETMGAAADPQPLVWCENVAVNAVASFYCNRAHALGAHVDVRLALGAQLGQSQADVVVVVGNLLENAVEALESQVGGTLELVVRAKGGPGAPFAITVDNTSTHAPTYAPNGRFLSSKRPGYGIGTESVRLVAEAHDGEARFVYKDGRFEASVLLAPDPRPTRAPATPDTPAYATEG